MAHRAKHLRRNWTAGRATQWALRGRRGPNRTAPTTGLAQQLKARGHRTLPVVAFLGRV